MKQTTSDRRLLSGLFFRLLPFQVLLIVINAVNGIVDSLYASNVIGQAAMGAIGLYAPLNHFLYAAGITFVSGSQILYGRYLARERERINSVFTVDLTVSLAVSVLTSLLLAAGALTGATRVLVDKEPELTLLNDYILGQSVGIPALILGQQLFAFLSLENQTKRTMTASILCFAVNGVLDHLFISVFSMGTFGLGLSSALASWVFLGVQAVYYLKKRSEWRFSFSACRWRDALDIARLGYPGALSRFVETFRCLIVNFLVLRYVGSVGLSAFAASNSFLAVIWALPFGMVAVCRMFFSISAGEEDRRFLADSMYIGLTRGMLIMAGVAAALFLSAVPLTRLFYQDPSDPVFDMTVMGFRLLPMCMPLSIISLVFAGYAQTMEKKTLSIVLPIVDGAAGVVLFSFILIPLLQMNGLYIANILNGVLCFFVILALAWMERKRCPRDLEGMMAIPDDFGAGPDDRIDITVRGMEEVVTVSRRIMDFCRGRGIDRQKAFYAALCMEEMAGNVVTHGFSKDNKKHSADLRVVRSGDQVILRIRDDCAAFDPKERADAYRLDEGGRNIGIHLVYGLAEKVTYRQLLGLNVLTIRL